MTKTELENENDCLLDLIEDICECIPMEALPEDVRERIAMFIGEEDPDEEAIEVRLEGH